MNTPIRRLEGITYWVIDDSDAIYDFVNTEIRKEWEEDARSERCYPKHDPWLKTLSERRWDLRIIEAERVRLDPEIMNYVDRKSGYNFCESLAERKQELCEIIQRFGVVIWPLIVREEDLQLVDGYCRYAALKALHVSRIYVYAGALPLGR